MHTTHAPHPQPQLPPTHASAGEQHQGGADLTMPMPMPKDFTASPSPTDSHQEPPAAPALDWTEQLPQTEHVRFFRTTDWAATALGPLHQWSPTLRLFAGFVLADSRAACLWWGDDLTAIYNETYAPLAAQVHPSLMGMKFQAAYPDLWPHISDYFEQCRQTGQGRNYSSALPLIVERKGWKEETFFSGSFTPIGPLYQPEGFYNSTYEVTNQKLMERRASMLNMLAAVPDHNVDAVFRHILTTLETNPNDLPFAMLYKFEDSALRLRGHIGLPEGHKLIVDSMYIDCEEGLIPDLRRAGSEATFIDYDERFDSASWKGYGIPSKKIAILPITSGMRLVGYLIAGTNPCRPHDEHCQQFMRELNRLVSSIVSVAIESESAKKRQEQLEADLAFSDLKLRHLIDHASVGMCHVSLDGAMLWANEHFYRLSGATAEDDAARYAFFESYHPEDKQKAVEAWDSLLTGQDHVSVEIRMKRMYVTPSGDEEPAQIQVLAFPYRDPETGSVKSIMACTTDISRLKWAQTFQARLAAEAREAKRQQEAFIDVVSHEMRNPLSAIVHCADAISSAIEECQAQLDAIPEVCLEALNDNVHNANIILQCANHQKRIIDDVLTLSKLDSMLLSITPVSVRPKKLVDDVMDIFAAELRSNGIQQVVEPDSSLQDLDIEHIFLDPSRVTQVFINLLTNAIKFVKSSEQPLISVRFGACRSEPRSFFPEDMFWATETKQDGDVTSSPEWGTGEELYLAFSVRDSGIGLQSKEIAKVFQRFRQANVKTHVKYGGSGLGLFISKELVEKQGGEIGVYSVFGQGSTFGFYVKTRRVEPQKTDSSTLSAHMRQLSIDSAPLDVLLVEDNLINQQVLSKQLKKSGCTVVVANHGLEALHILDKHTFDIVLMDSEMPILDGQAATRTIRQKELSGEGLLGEAMKLGKRAGSRLPIIAVTANVRQEQIDQAIAAGADRVMQKPFKARDLVYLMRSLLPPGEVVGDGLMGEDGEVEGIS